MPETGLDMEKVMDTLANGKVGQNNVGQNNLVQTRDKTQLQ